MISQHDSAWISNKHRKESTVEMPIRVNFGGGWSDTPPYCNENGGSVLNAAFLLNGKLPIRCSVKEIKDSKIILRSIDLNIEKEFKNIEELKDCGNINDEFILLKSALVISGVIRESDKNIEDVIQRIGCGICLETDVTQVPKGSGLGTSSILAGACIKAIYQFFNVEISDEKICYKVLEQEQLMETCGGWQDQIAASFGGLNRIDFSGSGYEIRPIIISPERKRKLESNLMLFFTGFTRFSSEIQKENQVVAKSKTGYLSEMYDLVEEAEQILVNKMKDIDDFGRLLDKTWKLKKQTGSKISTSSIDQLYELGIKEGALGGKLLGAGGGGFLIFYVPEEYQTRVKEAMKELVYVPFRFEEGGTRIIHYTPEEYILKK